MINEEKIKHICELAERLIDKTVLSEPVFFKSDSEFHPNHMTALIEGKCGLKGQVFATHFPITKVMYEDEGGRAITRQRLEMFWKQQMMNRFVPLDVLTGTPKGKLPS